MNTPLHILQDFHKDAIITGSRHISYGEMLRRISLFASHTPCSSNTSALLPATERDKVIIISENREGYVYAFFSVWMNNGIIVPVDAQSKVEEFCYVVNDCTPKAIWTSRASKAVVDEALMQVNVSIQVLVIEDYECGPVSQDVGPAEIGYQEEQTAMIVYTSGTTGSPKGAMLSFRNILTNVDYVSRHVPACTPDRRAIQILPLHHVFPLVATLVVPIVIGAGIAISPSLRTEDIIKTMKDCRIGMLIGVPLFWDAFHDFVMEKVNGCCLGRMLFVLCKNVHSIPFSRFVFHRLHSSLGGHLECCPSGGAALSPKTWRDMYALGFEIIEGYGLTECAPLIAFNPPMQSRPGCAGHILPKSEVCIKEGEICVKGDNVMQGYYNRPQETADVFDEGGWFHTGDFGYLDGEHLYVTGRKKDIIVLPNGKNINPEEIETKLEKYSEYVREVAVVLDRGRLTALIYPQSHFLSDTAVRASIGLIKTQVIDVYNQTVPSHKYIYGLCLTDGPFPRTRMGKIQRFRLKEIHLINEGCHGNSVTADSEELKSLSDFIFSMKHSLPVCPCNFITDLGMDSLDMLKLACFVEKKFGIGITVGKIAEMQTLTALAEFVVQHKPSWQDEEFNWHEYINNISDTTLPDMPYTCWQVVNGTRKLTRAFFNLAFDGQENIPESGQFIMVANHQSYLDTLFLLQGLSRRQLNNMCFLAKEKHVSNLLMKKMAYHYRMIVINEENIKDSVCQLCGALKSGANALIFPEGTRTDDGRVRGFKPTFAMLSCELNIPILPVCINGAYQAMPKNARRIYRRPVSVTFLPMIYPKDDIAYTELAQITQQLFINKVA